MSDGKGAAPEPWTILRLLQWTTEHLRKSGSLSPRLDAEVLLAEARRCQRIELYTAFSEEPPEEVKARFREFVKKRASGEPVAYLVGKKEFYSLPFTVSSGCLIPRGETEHLVIACLDRIKTLRNADPDRAFAIADVCTGSGCVAVSLAKNLQNVSIRAIDISDEALAVARRNVEDHGVAGIVEVSQGDLLDGVAPASLDFVVSNPPYVSEQEFQQLDRSVREYEPKIALVSGDAGTEIIDKLAHQAIERLKSAGWFLCEFSPMIADQVESNLQQDGRWGNITVLKDLAGHKRLIAAQKL
ncbi:Release factor glutamine methyltransferase [Pirellula sp. SH-Sr6A]|uniref:peptide chain release factor N(5)-glutamine methyltransferase n=1 Tax=Pirellula sp. SH-Sr6A TaxID=1632865 RepID=UPI00078B3384|nr:peptide chain release factor N(5)-glutamine methyltransferase [Pirellula sp. SH-Sr6A]AMV32689.1 Release factor glutamine methyltransferase [Pirellula sp. SH-Sr6A]